MASCVAVSLFEIGLKGLNVETVVLKGFGWKGFKLNVKRLVTFKPHECISPLY